MADWTIERMLCRYGTTDDTGCTLLPGVFYGSEKRREKFWVFARGCLNVWKRQPPEKRVIYLPDMVKPNAGHTNSSTCSASTGMSSLLSGWKRSMDMSTAKETSGSGSLKSRLNDQEMRWKNCCKPGVIRDLGGAGTRIYVARLRRCRRRGYGSMLWGYGDETFVAAALVNAIGSIHGRFCPLLLSKTSRNASCFR